MIFHLIILFLNNQIINGISCKGEYDGVLAYKTVSNYNFTGSSTLPGAFIIKKTIPIAAKRKNVDFYVGIRPPANQLRDGKDNHSRWNWSNRSLTNIESIIGKTFENVYLNPNNYSFIQYNTLRGSGALVWSSGKEKNAVWFIHSSSNYLNKFHENNYRPLALNKAFSFMCLHIELENAQKVYHRLMETGALLYGHNNIFRYRVAFNIQPKRAQLNFSSDNKQVIERNRVKEQLFKIDPFRLFVLSTVLNEPVVIVPKSKSDRDLFWMRVARRIGVKELYVKSNLIPRSYIKYPCANRISNVLEITLVDKNNRSMNWEIKPELDDINWGICGNEIDCYCISDMNNTLYDSRNNNGIAVCIFDSNLHKAFKDSIKSLSCIKR